MHLSIQTDLIRYKSLIVSEKKPRKTNIDNVIAIHEKCLLMRGKKEEKKILSQ